MAALIPNTISIRTFEDHGDCVIAVAALRDERMVTASYDGMLRLWDLKTGVVLKKMEGHRSRVRALAISPDGNWIASGDESGVLIVWDGKTGEPLNQAIEKAHDGWIFSLDFSSNSMALASGSSDTTTKLWYAPSWPPRWQVRHSLTCGGIVRCVRYSPRICSWSNYGSSHNNWSCRVLLAIATDHSVQISECYTSCQHRRHDDYDDDDYRYTPPFPTQSITTIYGGFNYSLAWTPNGRRLLSGGNGVDPAIREWDTSTWKQVSDPWKGHFRDIHAISLNSSGTLLASASHDNRVRLWRLSDRQTIAILKHSAVVNCVTFSADNKHILSGGMDKKSRVANIRGYFARGWSKGWPHEGADDNPSSSPL
ncbi:WD40-repeat-containing domain protein [Suillus spraguei]|nr:WD40-repeat-containing domain protein [Suillus spraguei]